MQATSACLPACLPAGLLECTPQWVCFPSPSTDQPACLHPLANLPLPLASLHACLSQPASPTGQHASPTGQPACMPPPACLSHWPACLSHWPACLHASPAFLLLHYWPACLPASPSQPTLPTLPACLCWWPCTNWSMHAYITGHCQSPAAFNMLKQPDKCLVWPSCTVGLRWSCTIVTGTHLQAHKSPAVA